MKTLLITIIALTLSFASATAGYGGSATSEKKMASKAHKHDIVDTAAANADFSTLVAAVKAAGLVDVLKSEGPFTVFAPTNDAFAKLPEGTVASLLKPENKAKLTAILTYHVVPGKVMAKDVKPMAVKTVQGEKVTFTTKYGKVKINDATIVATDIETTNGVIHVIDTVIIPEMSDEVAQN